MAETKTPELVGSEDVEAELVRRFPSLPRLVAAAIRRRLLLRSAASWRAQRMRQTDIAELIGSSQPAVARLERGKVDPKLSTLERYAAALDANFFWQIVDDDGNPVAEEFRWHGIAEQLDELAEPMQGHRLEEGGALADGSAHDTAANSGAGGDSDDTLRLSAEQKLADYAGVFAFEHPGQPRRGDDVDDYVQLLHRTLDMPGVHSDQPLILPVFTNIDALQHVFNRWPDVEPLQVVKVDPTDVLDNRDPDVTIICDPWSANEFQIPARKPGTRIVPIESKLGEARNIGGRGQA
jgi:transcriptional regulator with XRE-family HTH domain